MKVWNGETTVVANTKDPAMTDCGGAQPGFCDNGSMWIPLSNNVDVINMQALTLEDMPTHVCGLNDDSAYYYNPADGKFYAVHPGACDYYWDKNNCKDADCPGLVGSPVTPSGESSSSPPTSVSGMKWYHYAALGGLGAGAGYLLFKDRGAGGVAAVIGGGLSTLAVGAFKPGGWLRAKPTVGRTLRR